MSSALPVPVYVARPRYDWWLKLVLGGTPAMFLVLGIIFLFQDPGEAAAMFGLAVFHGLLFGAILPSKYQILQDRVRVGLGGPFAFNIPFSTIKEARAASGRKAFAYWGVRFVTSVRGVVEIVRTQGPNVVISPRDRDMFLEQLNRALALYRSST